MTVIARRPRKLCVGCDKNLLTTAFNKNRSTYDGLQGYCRPCSRYPERRIPKNVPRGSRSTATEMLCTDCLVVKPASEFRVRKAKDGTVRRTSHCTDCWNEWRAEHRHGNPEKTSAENRRDYLSKRGLSLALFEVMWASQEGLCAICKVALTRGRREKDSVHIDHDHETGQIRDLLCARCNTALGLLREDEDIVIAVLAYLRRWRTIPT